MAAANIVLANKFDVTKISFGPDVRPLDNAGRTVAILYDGKPLYLQTPDLFCPFGAKAYDGSGGGGGGELTTISSPSSSSSTKKLTMELALANKLDPTAAPQVAALKDAVDAFDRATMRAALADCAAWFQKKYKSIDVVEALFSPSIRFYKDKATGENSDKYPPNFRVSLYPESCKVFNETTHERIPLDVPSTKFAHVRAILSCPTVWISGGKFGLSWRAVQMVVVPQATNRLDDFAFRFPLSDDDDDANAEE